MKWAEDQLQKLGVYNGEQTICRSSPTSSESTHGAGWGELQMGTKELGPQVTKQLCNNKSGVSFLKFQSKR